MSKIVFESLVLLFAAAFALVFLFVVVPPLLESGDIIGAFAAGFVNPFSAGYSIDVILCAAILFIWIIYERANLGVKHGWVAIPLSFMPGVATGFGVYLFIRSRQLSDLK